MFTIITDSCADLLPSFTDAQKDFQVIPLTYDIEGMTYPDSPDGGIPSHEFYEKLRGGAMSKTSQINAALIHDTLLPFLKEGKQVLYIVFSSGLSGTYQSALIAEKTLKEEVPDAQVAMVDSLAASAGEGLLVAYALEMRDQGKSFEEVTKWVEDNKLRMAHWFTVDDLNFLKRGGRCSPAAAFFGSMLSIKPVLHVDNEGHLIAREKARGRKAALKGLVQHMEDSVVLTPDQSWVFISHADALQDAEYVSSLIQERFGLPKDRIVLSNIGPVIGSHAGPGTVALFFLAKDRG